MFDYPVVTTTITCASSLQYRATALSCFVSCLFYALSMVKSILQHSRLKTLSKSSSQMNCSRLTLLFSELSLDKSIILKWWWKYPINLKLYQRKIYSLLCNVKSQIKRFIENLVHIIIANKSYRIILIGFNAPDCLGLLLDIS